ncbi:UvrD-helicase domain-containing protein [Candidatus Parcubacteria bacterium]|nr:UvrD-helicase domain-containing protein [Candidatus Parcubacteria bacterium]
MQHLKELNSDQKQAVLQIKGPVLILAGAGSGKTKTITHRIFHLIKEGVKPSSILAITFTNKAAKEMKERVEKIISEDIQDSILQNFEKPFVSTFHSLGVYILKENSQELGIPKHFSIFDRNDSKKVVKEGIIKAGLDPKQFEPNKILSIISNQKGNFITHKKYSEQVGNEYLPKIISEVWNYYEETLFKEKALDFDDLLLKTALLLKNNEQIKNYYQKKWEYIHIDEYQDTNKVQYEISRLLVGENQNICAVGDDDQNVYSWRGADIKNILNFEKDYKNTKVITLGQNYRSTKNILSAAGNVIKKNKVRKEKNFFTQNEEGEKISLIASYTEIQEARAVAQEAKKLIKNGILPSEIAVLYRANFQSRVLEEYFMTESVPYQVLGTKFFDRKEIKDIISFLKSSLNPENITDVKRIINVPARGIGKLTILKLFSGKESELNSATQLKIQKFKEILKKINETALKEKPSDTIKFIFKITGLEDKLKNGNEDDLERLLNIGEFITLATKYDYLPVPEGIEKLLEDAALATDQDELDKKDQKEAVKLMTVHASKGLEFDYVFITGLEDKLFPSKREEKQTDTQKEEERRLFYVAITRARKKVYLTYASVRMIFGSKQMNPPSEFIFDIDEDLIQEEIPALGELNGIKKEGEKIIYLDF